MRTNYHVIRDAITALIEKLETIEEIERAERVRLAVRKCDPKLFDWTNKYNSNKSMTNAAEDAIVSAISEVFGCDEEEADQHRAWVWNRLSW